MDYGEAVKADDNAFLLLNAQALAESVGCAIHAGLPPVTAPEGGDGTGDVAPGEEGGTTPGDPSKPLEPIKPPVEPGKPTEPTGDPSGGFGDAGGEWWNDLWSNGTPPA